MKNERSERGERYLRELPPGHQYPDTDPYILELKRRNPEVLWDRYLPSEVLVERVQRFREQLATWAPQAAKSVRELPLPPGTWVYNATWESEWEEEPLENKRRFTKPLKAAR